MVDLSTLSDEELLQLRARVSQPVASFPTPSERVATAFDVAPEPVQTGTVEDVARAVPSGLRTGAETAAGTAGDINQIGADVAAWAAGKFGASPETQERVRTFGRFISAFPGFPTTEELRRGTTAIFGEPYEPETVAGQYARTAAEFAPAAVAAPGSVARRAATTGAAALGSETAGQLTKGTPLEPFARAAGALAGGIVASRDPTRAAIRGAARRAPTSKELKAATDSLYQQLRNAGIQYNQQSYQDMLLKTARDFGKRGYRAVGSMKEAFDYVADLAKDVAQGNVIDFDDVNSVVQDLGESARQAARTGDKRLAAAYNLIRNNLTNFERSAPLIQRAGTMSRKELNRTRTEARKLALQNIKARELDDVLENARTYASGVDRGIRQGLRNLLKSKRGRQLFKGAERQVLEDVIEGRKTLERLSRFGVDLTNFTGRSTLVPTATGGLLAVGGEPVIGGAVVAAGTAAKPALAQQATREMKRATSAIRGGEFAAAGVDDALRAEAIQNRLRQLIAARQGTADLSTP